jgi:hypothetical protein
MNDGQLYGFDYANKGEKKRQEMILKVNLGCADLQHPFLCARMKHRVGSSAEFGEISDAVKKQLKNFKNVYRDPKCLLSPRTQDHAIIIEECAVWQI